jgi:hypothetical protein
MSQDDKIGIVTGILETVFDGDRSDDISDIAKTILVSLGFGYLYEAVCSSDEEVRELDQAEETEG